MTRISDLIAEVPELAGLAAYADGHQLCGTANFKDSYEYRELDNTYRAGQGLPLTELLNDRVRSEMLLPWMIRTLTELEACLQEYQPEVLTAVHWAEDCDALVSRVLIGFQVRGASCRLQVRQKIVVRYGGGVDYYLIYTVGYNPSFTISSPFGSGLSQDDLRRLCAVIRHADFYYGTES